MVVVGVIALWAIVALVGVGGYQLYASRQRTLERFVEATADWSDREDGATDRSGRLVSSDSSTRRLARRWIWVPWAIGVIVSAVAWIGFGWAPQYVLAIGAVVSLLLNQFESFLHNRHIAKLERQLADAIDIMVGAVSSGAALGPAMDAATIETDRPRKPMGDSPGSPPTNSVSHTGSKDPEEPGRSPVGLQVHTHFSGLFPTNFVLRATRRPEGIRAGFWGTNRGESRTFDGIRIGSKFGVAATRSHLKTVPMAT